MGKYLREKMVIFILTTLLVSSFSTIPLDVEAKKFNMSYLYFGQSSTYIKQVLKTNNSLDSVSPSYFNLQSDGILKSTVDANFVDQMHQMNIRVVPFLSNNWDREIGRKALSNRDSLVKEIVDEVNQYHLDGINIDIEHLTEADRDNYTDFVKLLREQLPEEKELSVAVAANPHAVTTGWPASYDYEKLGMYSDYLMLMTYDESYYGSTPGPVSSIDYAEKSIQYALTKVPANKIVLGIPFYGRYWQVGYKGGNGIPLTNVNDLINTYGGKVYFDDKSKSPYAYIYIPYGHYVYVHGKRLYPGRYVIWYENDQSIKMKLNLVQKYNLLGTGSWSLNEAPEEIWDYYDPWLNGRHYFIDTENHWAELDILSMLQKGWMIGTSQYKFSPNKPLTRAQGTVVLVRALGLNRINSDDTNFFTDVSDGNWAKESIEVAYQNGLVSGVAKDKFDPNAPLTRAQMAAILSRVIKNKQAVTIDNTVSPFSDVSTSNWAYKNIVTLNQLNIFSGYNDGLFHPKDIVTRAQMAALMDRIANDIDNNG